MELQHGLENPFGNSQNDLHHVPVLEMGPPTLAVVQMNDRWPLAEAQDASRQPWLIPGMLGFVDIRSPWVSMPSSGLLSAPGVPWLM